VKRGIKITLKNRAIHFLSKRKQATLSEILGELWHHIDAAHAASYHRVVRDANFRRGRPCKIADARLMEEKLAIGRKRIVAAMVSDLTRRGILVKVAPSTYKLAKRVMNKAM
jgi:hypothetical protein